MGVFTERQEGLVKSSYEELVQNITHYSIRFFTLILEISPATKDMFSFLRDYDEIPQNNTKLQFHAVKVFEMTCETAIRLREKRAIVADTTLKYLSCIHINKGVIDSHFEVVKEALLKTIKEAVGDKWSEELRNSWEVAYDELAAAIKNAMREGSSST
ncbi:non-symbiotic hemoglobin 2-like [Gastrolobium bilobum]|uniref:non-symbiotic hemoglobin 2-like n=1 Tax=Gastrolobium bilobum TaxID=150636 RepID=UPI002AB2773D|nr:non-symbiotic hemoglobin 2-like [Gastrolobium bilobum]